MLTDQRLAPACAAGSATHSVPATWLASIQRLRAAWDRHRQQRLPRGLSVLTDDLLLDIGIDPRRVPNRAGELISRPDLNRSGLATPIWRTTAKS